MPQKVSAGLKLSVMLRDSAVYERRISCGFEREFQANFRSDPCPE